MIFVLVLWAIGSLCVLGKADDKVRGNMGLHGMPGDCRRDDQEAER